MGNLVSLIQYYYGRYVSPMQVAQHISLIQHKPSIQLTPSILPITMKIFGILLNTDPFSKELEYLPEFMILASTNRSLYAMVRKYMRGVRFIFSKPEAQTVLIETKDKDGTFYQFIILIQISKSQDQPYEFVVLSRNTQHPGYKFMMQVCPDGDMFIEDKWGNRCCDNDTVVNRIREIASQHDSFKRQHISHSDCITEYVLGWAVVKGDPFRIIKVNC
jgi:hypothetical protein